MASEEVGDHAVCGTASESFFGSIKREISYVPKYQSHIDDLENQVKQLGCKRQRVENLVNAARRQGDEIYKGVEQWLISIDEFTQRVVKPIIDYQDEAKKHCFKGLCPNLLKRYNLSKEAAKAAKDGANLLGKGNFSNFCFRPAPQRIELMSSRLYQQFNSRRSIFRDIMVAMKDDEVNMIGVYGSGGVGKTTLVKAVARQVIEEKLFDEVVMVEVTRTPDQKPIQDKIASDLGLQFGQHDDVLQRAGLLSERLKKEKRVLIILDDIWMRLDLDGIGIPFWGNEKQSVRQQEDWKERYVDQSRCKILLTSRNQHVLCNEMNIQKTFSIGVLSDEEALSFFWSNVGDAAGRSDFLPIGVEIVRECRGFPIAIITIANALKNKILFFWKDAFDQLRNSNQRRMGGEDANVNSIIELSYNFLESEEAKSLFRLCGLLNGGSQIPIDALMRCGMGLGLLKGVYTLQEARKRVHMLVNFLKASRLLLDGDAEECLKMHDIIHSIAASVATEELMFNMQNVADLKEELDKKTHKDPTAISIPFRGIYEFPERLECPKLKLFVLFSENLSLRIPDLFFEGMTELRVLSFTGFRFPSLPSSIGCLISLRTLTLESCLLGDVATIGDLKKLEILSLRHSDVEELPGEIGQLTRLKLLDLSNCMKLKVIRPNVISSLSRLEELYMGNSFTEWEIEGQSNASLVELKQLSRLTTLEVHIPDAQVMPQDLLSVELERYRICIGDVWSWSGEHETSRRLKLSALNKCIYLGYGMQMLLKGIEDLYLDELNGFQNALLELEDGEVFPLLKHLHVQNVCEILYIVNLVGWGHCNAFPLLESLFLHNLMRLEMVYRGQLTEHSFSKLRIIKVCQCDNLKHLFSFPMARNLLQLQKLKVSFCESLKLIVGKESSETHNVHEIINFTQLHSLTLQCLPQLTSSGFDLERPLLSPTISATTLAFEEVIAEDDSDESLFNNKVIFPNLEKLKLSSINIEKIWHDQYPLMLNSCSQNLTNLTVETCSHLKFLFPYSMVDSLVRLQQLEIRKCESMEAVIDTTDIEINSVEFPSLHHLRIVDCPNLRSFISVNSSEEKILHTDTQPLFDEKLVLPRLEVLSIDMMDNMRKIWHHQLALNSFSKLKALEVTNCGKLANIFPANIIMRRRLDRLEYLKVDGCASVEEIIGETSSNGNVCMVEEEEEARRSVEILFASPEYFSCGSQRPLFVLDPKVAFPGLKELELNKLPNLLHLWKENSQLSKALLNLATLEISECDKLEKLVPSSVSLENLVTLEVGYHDKACLSLSKFPHLKEIWHGQALPVSFFINLRWLVVDDCRFMSGAIPANQLQNLINLKTLEVRNCYFLEQVFHLEEQNPIGQFRSLFPKLRNLKLINLPQLIRFCNFTGRIIELPSLVNLWIENCRNMKTFISSSTPVIIAPNKEPQQMTSQENLLADIQPLFDEKVAFPSLKELRLSRLPKLFWLCKETSHPRNVFQNECSKLDILVPSSVSFGNLSTLEVSKCGRLMNLMTISTAERLVNLERMNVTDCKMIQQIIQQVGEVEKDCIVFSQLKYLGLHCLPSLKSFCMGNKALEFPCLEQVIVEECPKMKIFSQGVLHTPKLRRLQLTEEDDEGRWEGNLNSTIQKLFVEMVGFCDLKCLKLSLFPNLKEIWHVQPLPVSFFSNLRSLVIDDCMNFSSAIPANLLRSLNNLEKLEVTNCDSLEEVFHLEEPNADEHYGSLFPKLRKLKLKDLPKLKRFCYFAKGIIELPFLSFMWIESCPNMVTFVSNSTFAHLTATEAPLEMIAEENILADIQPLFDEKVGLPSLEELGLSRMDNLRKIWDDHLTLDSFCKINYLGIRYCNKLLNVFPRNMLGRLQKLRWLFVGNCNLVEEIVELQALSDDSCAVTAAQLSETIPSFVLPQLISLTLSSLPSLKSFYPGVHISKWPMLKKLEVMECAEVEIFASEFQSPHQTNVDSPRDIKIPRPLFSVDEVAFPSLEELTLCVLPDLLHLLEESSRPSKVFQNLATLKISECGKLENLAPSSVSFQNLMSLEVSKCDGLINLVTLSTAESLVKLTTMHIAECMMIEEIIQQAREEVRKDCLLFSQLKYLGLHCLPSLVCFCLGNYALEFPTLEKVVVRECPKMEIFSQGVLSTPKLQRLLLTESEDEGRWEGNLNSTIQKLFEEMVGLCDINYLELSQFPHLKEMWHRQALPVSFFSNLSWLVVEDCTFFSSAIPVNLMWFLNNLKILEISNCDSLEEVFHLEELNANEHFGPLFPTLRKLKLKNLPKLIRFCNFIGNVIRLPSLSYMWIESCPNMITFISNSSPVPLTANKEPHEMTLEENFLADIQPLFDEKVGLPSLEELAILSMDSLRKLWQDELSLHSFYNLKFLGVQKCNKLLNIFPCNMLERLQKLQKLQVLYCSSVREIFELRALSGRDTHTIKAAPLRESDASFVFPQLTSLSLWWLPRLKSFYPQVQISEWPMLKKLDVGGCAEVEIFASEVLSLQETHVDSQHNIQIPQYLFFVDKVAFPSLEELMLFRLPKLLHLWKGNSHPSKVFPNLASLKLSECTKLEKLVPSSMSFQNLTTLEVIVMDCLKMMTFSQGALCTPKLHRLQLTEEDDEGCWDGNLNNTIQQLFKRVFSTRIPLQLSNSRPTACSPRSSSNQAKQCPVRLPLHRLLRTHKLVRARRVFSQRKPSDAQVRNPSFESGLSHDPRPSPPSTLGSGCFTIVVVAEWTTCLDSQIGVLFSSTIMDRVYPPVVPRRVSS
ncbi:hypothetical protein KPL70_015594 [Citrus sinensis]|nr:hypothetical protein KPL70_015594 [Citrus sinensis]